MSRSRASRSLAAVEALYDRAAIKRSLESLLQNPLPEFQACWFLVE